MKAFRLLGLMLFIMVAALIQQPPASGDPAPPENGIPFGMPDDIPSGDDIPFGLRDDIPPGEYTYEEASALGMKARNTPEELGVPPCDPPDPNWVPDDSPVPDDAPICADDPHDVIISHGRPVPQPYH